MDEGEIIEMAAQLKVKFEKLEMKEKLLDNQMLELTKKLCGIYGLIRILDNLIEDDDRPELVDCLLNNARSEISELLFRQIQPPGDD